MGKMEVLCSLVGIHPGEGAEQIVNGPKDRQSQEHLKLSERYLP